MLKKYVLGWVLVAIGEFAVTLPPAFAADSAPSSPGIAGWSELTEGLRTLPDRLLAKLPESMRNDPQVQQEIARLILETLAFSAIDAIGGDGDHPAFLPASGPILNFGQPNADTVYRVAHVTPGGTYRLRGKRGSLRIVSIGQVGATSGKPGETTSRPGPTKGYQELSALRIDAQGRFDVLLGSTRPDGYEGDWWPLIPTTNKLMLRMVSSDWSHEESPTISIERIDRPVVRPRPTAADLEQRLRQLPGSTAFLASLFVDHVEKLRQEGYVNKLRVFDVSQIGGLEGQVYYEGAYDLRQDDALLVEAKVPASCVYRSLILTNEIYETTDWYNNHSSLNDSQAKPDKDGVLRIVVAAKDPGVANWLDTAGYPRGVVQGRWTGCDSQPVPSVRKVAFTELRNLLPSDSFVVTPAQREAAIRERRSALQQRPLW